MNADKLRQKAAQMLGRLIATPEGRKFFSDNGYEPGMPIIACDDTDLIGEVFVRIRAHHPPVVVAVRKSDDVGMMTVTPGVIAEGEKSSTSSPSSTIGMLYDDVINRGGNTTYCITEWEAARTTAFPSAAALLPS